MATKSKSYKYKFIIKLAAFLLAIVFAGLCGLSAFASAKEKLFYPDANNIANSPVFLAALTDDLYDIESIPSLENILDLDTSYEEFLEKSPQVKITREQYERNISQAYALFDEIKQLKNDYPSYVRTYYDESDYNYYDYEDNYYDETENGYDLNNEIPVTSYHTDGEPVTAVTQAVSETSGEGFTYRQWREKFIEDRGRLFSIVNDATSKETIKAELDSNLETDTRGLYEQFRRGLYEAKNATGFYFYVKNKADGSIKTNLSTSDDFNAFKKAIADGAVYYFSYDGKKAVTSGAPDLSATAFYDIAFGFEQSLSTLTAENSEIYIKVDSLDSEGGRYNNIVNDFYKYSTANGNSYLALCAVFAMLSLGCFVFTTFISGKKKDGENDVSAVNKIPFIFKLLIDAEIVALGVWGVIISVAFYASPLDSYITLLEKHFGSGIYQFVTNWLLALGFVLISVGLLDLVIFIKENVAARTFARRIIVVRLFKRFKNYFAEKSEKAKMPAVITAFIAIIVAVNAVLMLLCAGFGDVAVSMFILFICFLFDFIMLVISIKFLDDINKLNFIAQELAKGNYNVRINTQKFSPVLRKFAVALDTCRSANKNAVDEAVKGERMKTELITNVSHDLKTPLTSIINYVSLLKLPNCTDEDREKYIDILDDKSTRLKRLIEDLVEASKATSGNVKMELTRVNLCELAIQAVGEYSDGFETAGLELVYNENEKSIAVNADAQHTFRIMDNLFSNARKYSLTGTRVYVRTYRENGYGCFEIKNVSREKLNISAQELTERFVRGDNSRTTEGSGLGLSIAENFTTLQNGVFNLDINGDMFTATVKLHELRS